MKNDYKPLILGKLNGFNSGNINRLSNAYYINEAIKPFKLLTEDEDFSGKVNPENPNQITWDNLDTNIKKSTKGVNTLDKAKDYFKLLHNKVKSLPRNVKKKAFNAAIIGLGTLMLSNIGKTKELLSVLPLEVRDEVVAIDNPVMKTIKDVSTLDLTDKIDPPPKPIMAPSIRKVSDNLVNFLKDEEGSPKHKGEPVLTAYDLGDGAITIGYGHAERKGNTNMVAGRTKISKDKAEELLKKDIKTASDALNRILNKWEANGIKVDITQGMYDSMVSLIYNMGIGNFKKSQFIQLVKQNKLEDAKKLIGKTHITYPGHKPRRKAEAEMFTLP